jgi:hypothetical protein
MSDDEHIKMVRARLKATEFLAWLLAIPTTRMGTKKRGRRITLP